jgi:hypothetical protein
MHEADTRRTRSRPQRLLALLLASALILPASVGYAQQPAGTRPLFQVTSNQWQHVLPRWRSYPAGSWAVQGGALTNKRPGVKFKICGGEISGCLDSFQSLIEAPYHIPTTRYAVDAKMRHQNGNSDPSRGVVLLEPRTSAGPVPWLVMSTDGTFPTCDKNIPVLVGKNPVTFPGHCGLGAPPSSWLPSTNNLPTVPTRANRWYHYRLEVRGNKYKYFINGDLVQSFSDTRHAVGPGVVPGFVANRGPGQRSNRLWVKSITITALPS